MADKDALTARRLAQARGRERSLDLDAAHALNAFLTCSGPEREEHFIRFGERARDERDTHLVWSGGHLERDVLEPPIDRGNGGRLLLVDRADIFFAAQLSLEHLGAIEGDDQRVAIFHATHISRRRKAVDI